MRFIATNLFSLIFKKIFSEMIIKVIDVEDVVNLMVGFSWRRLPTESCKGAVDFALSSFVFSLPYLESRLGALQHTRCGFVLDGHLM